MTSVSLVDWKIEPRLIERGAERHGVGKVAVVGTAKPPSASSANKRLDVAQRCFAGGRIANMTHT